MSDELREQLDQCEADSEEFCLRISQLEAFIWEQTEALHNWWGDGSFRTAADDILFVEPSEWFAKYGTDPDQHPSWCPVIEREPCICGRSLFPETPPT